MQYLTRRAMLAASALGIASCASAPKNMAIQSYNGSQNMHEVVIIGAGLAGLNAARILEAQGYSPLIIEASGRIGGRAYTLDDVAGAPDAGGIQIGPSYTRFRAIARSLNVDLYDSPYTASSSLFDINGKVMTQEQWRTSTVNLLSETEKHIAPNGLFSHYTRKLATLPHITSWMEEDAQTLDISLRDFLSSYGASHQAMQLIEANLNGSNVDQLSMLHIARSMTLFAHSKGAVSQVKGGTQRMTDAMAAALRSDIQINTPIAALHQDKDGTDIYLENGKKIRAKFVICTIPFSVMRDIAHNLDLERQRIIASLPYTRASFIYLRAKTPFWQEDGLPSDIWSNAPLLGRVFVLDNIPPMLKIWLNGQSADIFDKMDEETAGKMVMGEIERVRPSAKGQLSIVKIYSWQKNKYARGIYHHIGTGQGRALAQMVQNQTGRIILAGEHMARQSSGLEGALESGESAAMHVLNALS
ncbi:hypothetical protein LPB140_00935 [Sphingorhabdus lutea]|uniref:Amine oxidase domain-containing protein n=1 Tax=Sphingorhabdus lutea TaxID=1913578 RepID=A0A1L3J944_9SPHN|nr:NAD(P)/FAD-dependent oxidoreductase [Sphingorhabdus lutea]APG61638.1 hypothetical protein LPB140_00935 [Sphingorhabdus lutea]